MKVELRFTRSSHAEETQDSYILLSHYVTPEIQYTSDVLVALTQRVRL